LKSNAKIEKKFKQDAKVKQEEKIRKEMAVTTIDIQGKTYPVQLARSVWSLAEQITLIDAYKTWDESTKNSQSKKLMPINRICMIPIPTVMGKSFGGVRVAPQSQVAFSPYNSKRVAKRKKVSDNKATQVDGREEKLPDIGGNGVDESLEIIYHFIETFP
jgi:hypothetical protein